MKKVLFPSVFLLGLLFLSCGNNIWTAGDFCITNSSSKNVSFKVKNYGEAVHSLNVGASVVLQLYDHPDFIFIGNPRVTFSSGFTSAMFYDMKKRVYSIHSSSLSALVLSEKNNMMTETFGGTVTIPAATVTPKAGGGYDVVPSSVDVDVYGDWPPEFSAKMADGSDATSLIAWTIKN
ncbi:MAG: hypothetical protein J6X95_00780 [Treponema sp.]|nr:hypothetical protein [Treponema sp.]